MRWIAEGSPGQLARWDGSRHRSLTDEDGPDGEGQTFLVDVGLVEVVEHTVGGSDASVLVTDDGEVELSTGEVVNVLDPAVVRVDVVGGKTDQLRLNQLEVGRALTTAFGAYLDASRLEVGVGERDSGELGGAHGRLDRSAQNPARSLKQFTAHVVIRVGEEDGPGVTDPLVESDLANGSVGLLSF